MRFVLVIVLCALGHASYGQQYLNAVPANPAYQQSRQPPVDPSQMRWIMQAQYGAGHTVVVPEYQWSQYGSGDSVIVPNDQMYRYPLSQRPRQWTFTVPLLVR